MNKEEFLEIVDRLKLNFKTPDNFNPLMKEWARLMVNRDAKEVHENIDNYLLESKYFPHISDLLKNKEVVKDYLPTYEETKLMIESQESIIVEKTEEELKRIEQIKKEINRIGKEGKKRYEQRINEIFEV